MGRWCLVTSTATARTTWLSMGRGAGQRHRLLTRWATESTTSRTIGSRTSPAGLPLVAKASRWQVQQGQDVRPGSCGRPRLGISADGPVSWRVWRGDADSFLEGVEDE